MFEEMFKYRACPCKGCERELKKKHPIECHDTCKEFIAFKKGAKNGK
jgi:hypothetical protein